MSASSVILETKEEIVKCTETCSSFFQTKANNTETLRFLDGGI